MKGPFTANDDHSISYGGNKIFEPISDVLDLKPNKDEIENRVDQIKKEKMWIYLARINHQINITANKFFSNRGGLFVPLPLTTRMISSPGAVYGREAINYTTDTSPLKLDWFNLPNKIFLAESSQIYLELFLIQDRDLKEVYSIYNSFRKEEADWCHLPEFHHIEFEGKVDQNENLKVAFTLIQQIISTLLQNNYEDLCYFLSEERIDELREFVNSKDMIKEITFRQAMNLLYDHTGQEKYKKITLENFGAWEEIKLTELLGGLVVVKNFPLLEVPFYHAIKPGSNPKVANNADIIWPGYREILGTGQRIGVLKELQEKAKIFNLPVEDYDPYLQSRRYEDYQGTSGFGLGWERLLQGLLQMPTIWSVCHFPRLDITMKP